MCSAFILAGKGFSDECRIKTVDVRIECLGKSNVLTLMCDSGNLLTDPISGKPVILMRKNELLSLLPSELIPFFESSDVGKMSDVPPGHVTAVRLIPSVSVGGDRLLFGYLPKRITVDGVDVSAVLAMGENDLYGSYPALVPEILIN